MINEQEETAAYGQEPIEPVRKIFTGHTLDLRDVLAISDIMTEWKPVQGMNGALYWRKMFIEICMKHGTTIRHDAISQQVMPSMIVEKQAKKWSDCLKQMEPQLAELLKDWRTVKHFQP
jgi:hypothetical protein